MSTTVTQSISADGINISAVKTLNPPDRTIVSGSIEVADATTDAEWSIGGIDVSQVVACFIKSSADVTLETNAVDASGGDTIALVADIPYVWISGSPDSLVLTQDIANTIYVTNNSGTAATVSAIIVQDGSP